MIDSRIEFRRMRPMYDKEIHRFLKNQFTHFEDDENKLYSEYKIFFKEWIQSSKYNSISGLDQFPNVDIIHGLTHVIDDMHATFRDRLIALPEEYPYHWRINPNMRKASYEEWKNGDIAILSAPYCYSGDLHENFLKIITHCEENNVDLHIDAAWFGPCRNIHIDLNSKAIKSISFSLSKGLGLGKYHTGVRFSKERWTGPVTIVNDFGYLHTGDILVGLNFMKNFSIDYFQDKYFEAYLEVVKEKNLIPSSTLHIAKIKNPDGSISPVGIRGFLREKIEGQFA